MKDRINRAISVFKSASPKRTAGIVVALLVLLALPLLVFVSRQQQNTQQNAAGGCTQYQAQQKTTTTGYTECESTSKPPKASDPSTYQLVAHDCATDYGVAAGAMVSVQTPGQTYQNTLGQPVPNVSCVYTCATSGAIAAGERCVDAPVGSTIASTCVGSYQPSTSSHVCNPGRICCQVALATPTCVPNVNSDNCSLGAMRCAPNGAGVQTCKNSVATPSCPTWTTTELCSNSSCTASGNTASCGNNQCTLGAVGCGGTDNNTTRSCGNDGKGGTKWNYAPQPCAAPFKCDVLSGQCKCYPGQGCPTAAPTASSTPKPTPSGSPSSSPATLNCTLAANPSSVDPNATSQVTATCTGNPTTFTWGQSCGTVTQVNAAQTSWKAPATAGTTCNVTLKACDSSGNCSSPSTPITVKNANQTAINLVLGLDGIGSTGDSQNPNPIANSDPIFRSNPNPNRKQRSVTVDITDSFGNNVDSGKGNVNYNSSTGKFEGSVNLNSPLPTGTYSVLVTSPGFLRRKLSTNTQVTSGGSANVTGNLIAGDIDGDNKLTILDYNILISCSLFSTDNSTCKTNSNFPILSSLTDTGNVDQNDYNLFNREWHNFQQGD